MNIFSLSKNDTLVTLLVFLTGSVLLASLLAYPHGLDQQIFSLYGDIIRNGGIPYRDAIEIKPPLVYYFYAISEGIFGNIELSIRIFEFVYQLLASYLLYRLTLNISGSKKFALGTYITYIAIYLSQGFWNTAQAESFAVLPGLALFWSVIKADIETDRRKLIAYAILAGVSLAAYCWFKYNFIILVPVILLFIMSRRSPHRVFFAISVCISFFVFYSSYVVYLYLNGALQSYLEVILEWAPGYAGLNPLFTRKTFSEIFWLNFPSRLFEVLTGSMTVALAAGIIYSIKTYRVFFSEAIGKKSRAVLLLLLLSATLFVSLILERRLFTYHYGRALFATAPFIAIGLWSIFVLFKTYWKHKSDSRLFTLSSRMIILALTALMLFFSPTHKLIDLPIEYAQAALAGENPKQHLMKIKPGEYYGGEFEVADSLRPYLNESDNIFVWGTHIGTYDILDKRPPAKMITTMQMVAPFTPKSWRKEVVERLYRTKPKFILVQMGDPIPNITGSEFDSYGNYVRFEELLNFVSDYYSIKFETLMYVVYERTEEIPDTPQISF